MAAPAVTITGNLKDIFGSAVVQNVLFTLCNLAGQVPRVVGTSIVVNTSVSATPSGGGAFTATLYGNDVIVPANTFYSVQFLNSFGQSISSADYIFTGGGSFDISTLTPITTNPVSPPSPNAVLTNPTGSQIIVQPSMTALTTNSLGINGATSGTITVAVPAVSGTNTNTWQAVNDTVVYRATTDTLTNKTLASPVNGLTTVSGSVPVQVATLNLPGQNGNISATTLYAVPSSGVGYYRLMNQISVTTAGAAGNLQSNLLYTDPDASVTSTIGLAQVNNTVLGSTSTGGNSSSSFYAKASTNIQYSTTGFSAGTVYTLRLRLEYLGA